MQNVWSNTQSFKNENCNTTIQHYNNNNNWTSHSFQSNNNGFYDSGPTSLPNFENRLEVDNSTSCSWFEMNNNKCFSKGGLRANQPSGPASLTMFGQSWSNRRDSTASSKQASLGSQEWGEMLDEVILDEMNASKENIGNLCNKLSVF